MATMKHSCLVGLLLISAVGSVAAGGRESVWVRAYDQDFYNWATPHEATVTFPPLSEQYSQVLLHYTIECPASPGDCDPWDRLGYLQILVEEADQTTTRYEIARIVTPYDITGGSYPGSCTWVLDVTDYRFLLHQQVTFSNYIESWMGDDRGWLVTIDFELVPGNNPVQAYEVVNLWSGYRVVYGDPDNPIDDLLQPVHVEIGSEVVGAKIRAITTGHGQGNTDNAAEFSNKWHRVSAEGNLVSHQLWRSDCAQNVCSPQGGTWTYPRAGWCPGDKVDPWDVDVSEHITPGALATFDYDVQPYENLCRPTNLDCIDGVTCADCDYNYTGHTEPVYALVGQLILYRVNPDLFADDFESGNASAWSTVQP